MFETQWNIVDHLVIFDIFMFPEFLKVPVLSYIWRTIYLIDAPSCFYSCTEAWILDLGGEKHLPPARMMRFLDVTTTILFIKDTSVHICMSSCQDVVTASISPRRKPWEQRFHAIICVIVKWASINSLKLPPPFSSFKGNMLRPSMRSQQLIWGYFGFLWHPWCLWARY